MSSGTKIAVSGGWRMAGKNVKTLMHHVTICLVLRCCVPWLHHAAGTQSYCHTNHQNKLLKGATDDHHESYCILYTLEHY